MDVLSQKKLLPRLTPIKRNMEYITCCVSGCKSKCPKNTENSLAVGEQIIHMFPVPRAKTIFNKWKYILEETKNKKLTKEDHICELHFQEHEIERFYITETSDGNIIEIEKSKPTLKSRTVPSLLLDLPISETNNSRTTSSAGQKPLKTRPRKCKIDASSIISLSSSNSDETVSIVFEGSSDSAVDSAKEQTASVKKCLSYQEVVENLQFIKRPNTSWSVACTDKFTIFARWNEDFLAEKRIVIEKNLTVRVFLKEWEINMSDLMDITSVNDISMLLEKFENYVIN